MRRTPGITGWGESYISWYAPEVFRALIEHFGPVVEGEDPFDIHALWRKMQVKALRWAPVGPSISALGGVEIALWDISG